VIKYRKDISKYIIPQLKSLAIKYLEYFDRVRSSSSEIKGATRYIAVGGAAKLAQKQIQEVAVTIVAKQKGIKLDRRNVTEIAKNSQSSEPAFSKKYEAFCIEVKNRYNIEMSLLITDLRDMRKSVLHQGYTPKEEEIVPIIYFTLGLLKRLKSVSEAT